MVLTVSIVQLRLNKISAGFFLVHGYSQWIWRFLWLTPLGMTQIVQVAFPFWRFVLLIAWFRLISEMAAKNTALESKVCE